MTKVGVVHENARISRRFWRKLISLRSILADYTYTLIPILYMYVSVYIGKFRFETHVLVGRCAKICIRNIIEILPKFRHTSRIGVTLESVQNSFSTRFRLCMETMLYHIELLPVGQRNCGRVWRASKITLELVEK